ncbi:M28 family metallopeptidase [Bacteroidota bacterium]
MKHKFALPAIILLLIVFAGCSEDSSTGPDEFGLVSQIIQSVNADSLIHYVSSLSGNMPVTINGETETISSRHRDFPGNNIAADYIQQKLEQFGLTVTNEYFSDSGRNIIASIEGNVNPDNIYIICAHYDCMPPEEVAPGADDNASGVAAVIEAARILTHYEFDNTVIFALWDEEEQGLIGSRAYAGNARNENINILGVINLDMIAWDENDDGVLKVQENADGSADFICSILLDVDNDYNLAVEPDTVHYIGGSDHRSFAEQDYPAILLIEDYSNDWNDYYHSPLDHVSHVNSSFIENCTKLALGTLSILLGITGN